ncbi:hypothetical protein EX895_001475 [Sporisorium graminicola]|uniref:Secreted protein n=1 Tax=Sporisorium graminicola TaxID=280036 RepID=A0A4U7KYQ5_9BASI|nr:hypothetical protein EX895_001475 [Sporisorium graminicola]TKY89690.1 hypothetical protein EX895_001475 [Sporisorium graminicola]
MQPVLVTAILSLLLCLQSCSAAALIKRGDQDSNGIDLRLRLGPPSPSRLFSQGSTSSPFNSPPATPPLQVESAPGPHLPAQLWAGPYQQADANALRPTARTAKYRNTGIVATIQNAVRDGTFRREPAYQVLSALGQAGASTSADAPVLAAQDLHQPITLSGKAVQEANAPTRQDSAAAPPVLDTMAVQQTNDAVRQALAPRPAVAKPKKPKSKTRWTLFTPEGQLSVNGNPHVSAKDNFETQTTPTADEPGRMQALGHVNDYSSSYLTRQYPLVISDSQFFPTEAIYLQQRIDHVTRTISSVLNGNFDVLSQADRDVLHTPVKNWQNVVRGMQPAHSGAPMPASPLLVEAARQDTILLFRLEAMLQRFAERL